MRSGQDNSIDTLLDTVQKMRAKQFRHVPGEIVSKILDLEIENEENPEAALRGIEQLVTDAASGRRPSGGT